MEQKPFILIDFDSTFVKVESLDVLGAISLSDNPEKEQILNEIVALTNAGMEGKASFADNLKKRLQLLKANTRHLPKLVDELKRLVSPSVIRNKKFFELESDRIYILSSGFREFIVPVVEAYGLKADHVIANEFQADAEGNIIGAVESNPLSQDGGKIKALEKLNLQGEILMIGDGWTDYEVRKAGIASKFYAFTENVSRESVIKVADHITPSFDEFLYDNKLPMALSYPKSRIKVLLLENIHPEAVRLFKDEGYQVEVIGSGLDEDELCEKIQDVTILGIRSKTIVTEKVLEHANKLMAIGAFCIGTNQINLKAATAKGVAVFNAPFSNTRSVVELALGEIILLYRRTLEKSMQMHQGKWDKSAKNSYEIRGKKLGIIGYGNIGSQLSVVAESVGMEVYYYDIVERLSLGNARKCTSLHELLSISDVVTLHVDGRAGNKNLIGEAEFKQMKDGVIFVNLSRGHVVDIDALVQNLKSGKVIGAAADVFPEEPKSNKDPFESPLVGLPNVILTPHIGGSTEEAQFSIGQFVPSRIMDYINTGNTLHSVNFPNIQLPELNKAHRLMHLHENVPGLMAKINQVLAEHNINILGQYLKTNETIGYVILDIDRGYPKLVIEELKQIPNTIRFRTLY
jgi:D-3-phosphoglycerate dehydrogenase